MNLALFLSLLQQQTGPADTTDYMWLGFGVIFLVMALHVYSLYSRRRNLQKDLELLEGMRKGE